jgi:hypothetical protein
MSHWPLSRGTLAVAVLLCLLAVPGWGMFRRATLEVNGRVVARHVECQQPKNNRCVATYKLTHAGRAFEYIAGPTDYDLHDLPVGADIVKEKWNLSYAVDGRRIDDYPAVSSFVVFGLFLALVLIASSIAANTRKGNHEA